MLPSSFPFALPWGTLCLAFTITGMVVCYLILLCVHLVLLRYAYQFQSVAVIVQCVLVLWWASFFWFLKVGAGYVLWSSEGEPPSLWWMLPDTFPVLAQRGKNVPWWW